MISFPSGQMVLVTGASSGIGAAIALSLNRLGVKVLAVGRNGERLKILQEKSSMPENMVLLKRDLTHEMEELPSWVSSLCARYGKLAGLAHAAGMTWTAPLREYELTAARALFDINVHVPMLLAKGFADRRNNIGKGASMVFLAAAAAVTPVRALLVYSMSKGAIITGVRSMSKELAGQGIRVNCISPGLVNTPMGQEFIDMLDASRLAQLKSEYPLGLGEPNDVASAAVYLLSSLSGWMTGQNLYLAGGWG